LGHCMCKIHAMADGAALTIYISLRLHQFFGFCMAFVIPALYGFTLLVIGGSLVLRQWVFEEIFAVTASIYGLGWYCAFLFSATPSAFYAGAVPLTIVLLFWINALLKCVGISLRRLIILAGILGCVGGIFTNNLFLIYPNAFNQHIKGLDELKSVYLKANHA
jgi:hypothetical protein